ncbi:MAG TPA: patatin-like phospholipase family protein [Candidatus Binataceae bacterium]|nr:patatin-like phospholipase family protein [Candidatus Binataceae bacterium]
MPERRLAISIKGGVSLGAYEAGALTETLRLIQYNNSLINNTKWYIDVLTGASAGSITAVLVALALINQNSNYLYQVWVKELSFGTLCPPPDSADPAANDYLLDAASLDMLANKYVQFPAIVSRHPALRPGDAELRLRFTLSRVNPIVTAVSTSNGDVLNIEQYAQNASFITKIDSENVLSLKACGVAAANYTNPNQNVTGGEAWNAMQQAGIASGTFPLAFAPRQLRIWDSQRQWLDTTFIDGGLFDNDPVGEAINLAHDIDWYSGNDYDDYDRRYLIVHTAPSAAPGLLPNTPNSYALLINLINSLLTESGTSGLRGIIEVNRQFAQRSDFIRTLADQISAAVPLPPGVLNQLAEWRGITISQLAFLQLTLIPDLQHTDPEVFATIDALPEAQKVSFTDLALAMDLALGLADKVRIDPILIVPQAAPGAAANADVLAGDPLYGFGGFLVSDFRTRDFEQGRYDAWQAWSRIAQNGDEFTVPAPDNAEYPPPIMPEDASEVMTINRALYEQGRDQFFKRVDTVADQIAKGIVGGSGGLLSPVEQQIARVIIDMLAHKVLA